MTYSFCFVKREVSQQVGGLATKSFDTSLIPLTHKVKGDNDLLQDVSGLPMHALACTHTHTHTLRPTYIPTW